MTDQQRREKQTERPYPEHGACTGPCCAPELWAAGIKGSGQAAAPPVAHTGFLQHVGPWKCARCSFEIPYDPNWNVMSAQSIEHQQTAHPEAIVPVAEKVGSVHICNSNCIHGAAVPESHLCPVCHVPLKFADYSGEVFDTSVCGHVERQTSHTPITRVTYGPDIAAVPKSQDGLPPLMSEINDTDRAYAKHYLRIAALSEDNVRQWLEQISCRERQLSAARAELEEANSLYANLIWERVNRITELIAEQADKRKFILETERLNRDLDTANHALADARAELEEANSLYANLITELRGELSIARAELEEAQAHEATATRDNLKLALQLIHAKVELAAATQKIARYEAVDKHEDDKRDRI